MKKIGGDAIVKGLKTILLFVLVLVALPLIGNFGGTVDPAHATVTVETARIQYNCNGVTTAYTYPFEILEDDDLLAIKASSSGVETTLVLNTDYTVAGAGSTTGGTVTLTAASKCASGYTLTLLRNIELTQETDYVDGEAFSAESLENAIDKMALIQQQQAERIDRSLKLKKSSTLTNIDIPSGAGKVIGWNSAGTGLTTYNATAVATTDFDNFSNYSGFNAAISSIGATEQTIVCNTAQTVSADVTVPANVHIVALGGCTIDTTGYTLTINGDFQAGLYQVFSGTGTVSFGDGAVNEVYPEWWGAKRDGVTDDSAAFNIAVNLGVPVRLQAGTYLANVVHSTGEISISGAGQTLTQIKSYTADGYAWSNQIYSGSWTWNEVFNDLQFLGDSANRNGYVFGDPAAHAAGMEYAGRVQFNRVAFINNNIGVNIPWGNIGNEFNSCHWQGGDYHIKAESYGSMYVGQNTFNKCFFTGAALASIYVDSNPQGGGFIINDPIFESNPGFAIFVLNYNMRWNAFRVNHGWFEANASSATVIIGGVAYTTRNVYFENVTNAIFDGCSQVTYNLVNSSVIELNSTYNGLYLEDVIADSLSHIIAYNVVTDANTPNLTRTVYSYATVNGAGRNYSDAFKILPRNNILYFPPKLAGESFSGAGPWTFTGSATPDVDAVTVADGVLYSSCATFDVLATKTYYYATFASDSTKFYVYTIDVKLMTTAKPSSFYPHGTEVFARSWIDLIEKDKWVSIGGIVRGNYTALSALINVTGHATDLVTLRFSAAQVVEFDTEQDAINFFNNRTYSGS